MRGGFGTLLFVAQSPTQGGVVTVLETLLSGWPKDDPRSRVLVCNKGHGGLPRFRALAARGYAEVVEAPLWDPSPGLYEGRHGPYAAFAIRAAYRLASPFLALFAVAYFALLSRKLGVFGLLSHNGGYPGGLLNRACILGAWLGGVRSRYLIVHNLARRPSRIAAGLAAITDRIIEGASSGILAVSAACASSLVSQRYFAKLPTVVHNGIVLSVGHVAARVGAGQPDFVIGFVGELSPRKGLDVLLDAMAALPVSARLLLFGSGNPHYTSKLHARIVALGFSDRVDLRGYVADAAVQMQQLDLVVLPSIEFESFGMVLLEAMQRRLPVVVSDVGGMKEIVVHGETGLVVPAGNADALAEAILSIMTDSKRAIAMGEAGYRRLTENFSAEKMISIYCSLMSEYGHHAGVATFPDERRT